MSVADLKQSSSNDVYVVEGERTIYLPALKSVVKNIDLEQNLFSSFNKQELTANRKIQ